MSNKVPELNQISPSVWQLRTGSMNLPNITLRVTGKFISVDLSQFVVSTPEDGTKEREDILVTLNEIADTIKKTVKQVS